MTFEDVWKEVKGLPNTARIQVPGVLSESTKMKMAELSPEEVCRIVAEAIEDVNNGSVVPLDTLIKNRL